MHDAAGGGALQLGLGAAANLPLVAEDGTVPGTLNLLAEAGHFTPERLAAFASRRPPVTSLLLLTLSVPEMRYSGVLPPKVVPFFKDSVCRYVSAPCNVTVPADARELQKFTSGTASAVAMPLRHNPSADKAPLVSPT